MQISRLFAIVYILLGRGRVTARELAGRFEVSVRTIYRDIDALAAAGVPVYTTQGAGGGIHISDAYVLNKSTLTDAEQNEILLALNSLRATGEGVSSDLLKRLAGFFDKSTTEWIEVDFSRWGSSEQDRQTLATVKEGILQTRNIAFVYHAANGGRTERRISPIKLLFKNNAWYVDGFCHVREDYRTFKLVRMTETQLLADAYEKRLLPPKDAAEDMETDGEPLEMATLELRFSKEIAWRVLDEFEPGQIRWDADGFLRVRAVFPQEPWLYGYLLSFGENVEVMAPESVRRMMEATLLRLLERYA